MSALAQCTPGDPVLLPAESKHLAYNSLIYQSQFLVQDKLYLNAGIDPQKSYTLASVLAVDTTLGMQRVFSGNSPSNVIVGPEADKDQMIRVADCVARLHTTLVQLSIVILSPPEGLDDANFILSAIEVHNGLREWVNPERIWRADRVVSSTVMACQLPPWVVVSTPTSRATTRRPAYKKFSLMTPGHDPTVDWFAPVDVLQKMLAIMFHKQWEQELMTFLGSEPRNEVVVPGPDVKHTRILFKELDLTRRNHWSPSWGGGPGLRSCLSRGTRGPLCRGNRISLLRWCVERRRLITLLSSFRMCLRLSATWGKFWVSIARLPYSRRRTTKFVLA